MILYINGNAAKHAPKIQAIVLQRNTT